MGHYSTNNSEQKIGNISHTNTGICIKATQTRILLFSQLSRLALGRIQPPIQWVPEAVNKGQKQRGWRDGHLLSCSTEVKNALNYTYPSLHAFMVCTFRFVTHLIHLPTKSAKENFYTAPNAFLVVTCFHSNPKNIRKWISSENVSRISHSMMGSCVSGCVVQGTTHPVTQSYTAGRTSSVFVWCNKIHQILYSSKDTAHS